MNEVKQEKQKGWIPLVKIVTLIIVAVLASQLTRINWLLLEPLRPIVAGLSDILLLVVPLVFTALIVHDSFIWSTQRGWLVVNTISNLILTVTVPSLFVVQLEILFKILYLFVLLPIVGFILMYAALAPNNCFFTFVKEGTAKYVVRGDKFEKCLIQWKGHTFDEEWNVVPENTWVKEVKEGTDGAKKYKEPWHPFGGLRFYGIWPILDIHIYKFRWTGVTESGGEQHKEEWIDFILLQEYTYKCTVEKAEDKDLLPLDIEVWLPTLIVNPRKARFDVQDWLETVIKRIQPPLRQRIARDPFRKLNIQLKEVSKEIWTSNVEAGLVGEDGEFVKLYGVLVRATEIRQITPPGDYLEATLREYIAKQDARAVAARAGGEKKRLKMVYGEVEKFGDLGKLLRTLEAMEKSPLAASVTIQAIPGLPEILRGIFGKPPEEATLKEIRELREIVEKMSKAQKKK